MLYDDYENFQIVDRQLLKKLYTKKFSKPARRKFFDELARILSGSLDKQVQYADATIDRMMNGSRNFMLSEAIAAAKVLEIPLAVILNPLYKDFFSGTEIDNYSVIREFKNSDEYNNYMYVMESEGRYVLLRECPSTVYTANPNHKRIKLILEDGLVPNTEYYPLRSILQFAFSRARPYPIEERIKIFNKMLEVFNKYTNKNIYFYDFKEISDQDMIRAYAGVNIVQKLSILIIGTPMGKFSVIEMKNENIAKNIYSHFNIRHNEAKYILSKEDSLEIINVAVRTLKKGGNIVDMYKQCEDQLPDLASFILRQLSPNVQETASITDTVSSAKN